MFYKILSGLRNCALVVGLLLAGSPLSAQSISADDPGQITRESKATIVVYGAFTCPHTKQASVAIRAMRDKYGRQLAVEFRHFPMSRESKDLLPHLAALAAGEQGRFAEFHDALFASETMPATRGELIVLADLLGLEKEQFRVDLDRPQLMARVEDDIRAAQGYGAVVAPTLFVQGFRLQGVQTEQVLDTLIGNAISTGPATMATVGTRSGER